MFIANKCLLLWHFASCFELRLTKVNLLKIKTFFIEKTKIGNKTGKNLHLNVSKIFLLILVLLLLLLPHFESFIYEIQ